MQSFNQYLRNRHSEVLEEGMFRNLATAGLMTLGSMGMAQAAPSDIKDGITYNIGNNLRPVKMEKHENMVVLRTTIPQALGLAKGKEITHQRMTGMYKTEAEKRLGQKLTYTNREFEGNDVIYYFSIGNAPSVQPKTAGTQSGDKTLQDKKVVLPDED